MLSTLEYGIITFMKRLQGVQGLPPLLIVIAIPMTVFLAQESQDARNRAQTAGAQVTDTGSEIDIQFGNGHHMLWVKNGCGLDTWKDARGVVLGRLIEFQPNGQGQNDQRQYVGYHINGNEVTVDCTANLPAVTNVHFTW